MITVFANPKGGVGKSLLSFNYAIYQQLKGKEVIVVDLDAQHSILKFQKIRSLNSQLKPLNIKIFDEDSESLLAFLDSIDNEEVVIDTGGFDSEVNRYCVASADKIIVPIGDSPVELMRLVDFNDILSEIESSLKSENVNKEIIGNVLFNRVHPNLRNLNDIVTDFSDMSNLKFLTSMVRDRARIKNLISSGMSALEEGNNKDERAINDLKVAFQEIDKLWTEIEFLKLFLAKTIAFVL